MNTVQAHILARVKLPFSFGVNPGCSDIIWSTPTHFPGFVKSPFLSFHFLPFFDDFVHQFLRCCDPNKQDTHGGGRSLRRRTHVRKSPAFDSQKIIEYGRWKSRWLVSINYCFAGFDDLGLRMDTTSWSLSCIDGSWTSGRVVGSDSTSGFSGQLRYSRGTFSLAPFEKSIVYSNIPFLFSPLYMTLMTVLCPWFL